jgi:GAF domain-containing protein
VGVLEAVNKAGGPFDQHDLALLEAMSAWAGEDISNARAYELQRRQRRAAENLVHLTSVVASTLELPQVLARVLQQMMGVVDCAEAWIALREGDEMRVVAARSRLDLPSPTRPGRSFGIESDDAAEVLRTRRPALRNARADQPARLIVPLALGERVIGQVAFDRLDADYTAEEAEVAAGLAQPAAAAVENAQLYAEATRRLQEMTILHEVALATSTTLDLDELLRRTMQTLHHSMNYERVIVMLTTAGEAGDRLVLHPASVGLPPERLRQTVEFGQGAVGRAAHTGQPQRSLNGPADGPGRSHSEPTCGSAHGRRSRQRRAGRRKLAAGRLRRRR